MRNANKVIAISPIIEPTTEPAMTPAEVLPSEVCDGEALTSDVCGGELAVTLDLVDDPLEKEVGALL